MSDKRRGAPQMRREMGSPAIPGYIFNSRFFITHSLLLFAAILYAGREILARASVAIILTFTLFITMGLLTGSLMLYYYIRRIQRRDRQEEEIHQAKISALNFSMDNSASLGYYLKEVDGMIFDALPAGRQPKRIPEPEIIEMPSSRPTMTNRYQLTDYVSQGKASLSRLFIGLSEDNQPVYEDFRDMFHLVIAGTTRWGKSVMVQSLMTQMLWCADEGVQFYLIDSGGTTFSDFDLPFVDEAEDAELLVFNVLEELTRRKKLFMETKSKNLNVYNAKTSQQLPRLVIIIEEGLDLLGTRPSMNITLKRLVSWAAKYGLHVIFVSQSVKTTVLDNDTRSNFSSKFQFRAEGRHQAQILIPECTAHEITEKGRCFGVINGRPQIQLQAPLVDEEVMSKAGQYYLTKNSVQNVVTKPTIIDLSKFSEGVVPENGYFDDNSIILQYQELVATGEFSWRKATKKIYNGRWGDDYNTKLRNVLDRNGINYQMFM